MKKSLIACLYTTLSALLVSISWGAESAAPAKVTDGDLAFLIRQLVEEHPARLEFDPPAEAAIELAGLGVRALNPLMSVLGHDRADARRLAAWALGEIGDRRATAALAGRLDDEDGFVRAAAETALIRIGAPAADEIGRFLEAERADTRLRAGRLLGVIGGDPADVEAKD